MNDSDRVNPNGPRILELRKSCGITQTELAKESGYNERTIRNAESSVGIRFSSLVAIATALNRKGITISALDLCTDPVEIVRQFVEAYRIHEQGLVEKVRHLISDELEVFIAGDPERIPFAGGYFGPNGLQKFWDNFFCLLERPDKNALNLTYYTNGNEVVAYGTEFARIKGTNTEEPTWLSLLFRVENGLIVRFEDYFDTAPAQARVEEFRKAIHIQNEKDIQNAD